MSPPHNSAWPLNAHGPVGSVTTSETPIVSLELWVDGVVVWRQAPAASTDPTWVHLQWVWAPGSEGEHALLCWK